MRAVLTALVLALLPAAPAAASPAGAVRWEPCHAGVVGARCGHVAVPLDRLDPLAGTLHIGFRLYARTDAQQPSVGTLVAIEGGPGYATTGPAAGYLTLLGPLMTRRDLLLVDARGTGSSDVLECPAFARWITHYQERAGRCAWQLGPVVNRYDTHAVADDLASVLDALGIDTIDLYGDSLRRFVEALSAGDTSCAEHVAEVRTVDVFPRVATDVPPAQPAAGDASTTLDRQAAAVAAQTLADAVERWQINYSGHDRGLRGGSWSYTGGDVVHFRLARARFAGDVAVSGQATWDTLHGPLVAHLRVRGPGRLHEQLAVAWDVQEEGAVATLAGRAGARPLHATMLAP